MNKFNVKFEYSSLDAYAEERITEPYYMIGQVSVFGTDLSDALQNFHRWAKRKLLRQDGKGDGKYTVLFIADHDVAQKTRS